MADNLTSSERAALKSSSSDERIIIRNADKVGTVVVLYSDHCKNEALRQLSDTKTYLKLKGDSTQPFRKELFTLLGRAVLSDLFTQKERDMFITDYITSPKFIRG